MPDERLVWKLAPVESGPLATNELGLRDGPYRPEADRKVLLLGDSVAWGDGIEDASLCFPALLEAELAQRDPTQTWEVINAAVPGYATFQQRTWLELHGLDLEPDLVLLQFCLNDITARYQVLAAYGGDDTFLGIDTRASVPGLHGFLLRNSKAYERLLRGMQRRARDKEAYEVEKLAQAELSPELQDALALTLSEIDGLISLCREREIPFGLVIVPYAFQLQKPKRMRQPQDRLLEFAEQRAVPALDLLPAFALARSGPRTFRDPSHLSLAGHALAARELTPFVRAFFD